MADSTSCHNSVLSVVLSTISYDYNDLCLPVWLVYYNIIMQSWYVLNHVLLYFVVVRVLKNIIFHVYTLRLESARVYHVSYSCVFAASCHEIDMSVTWHPLF